MKEMLKKCQKTEIKNFEKITGVLLVILTAISLVINVLQFTYGIYSCSYEVDKLNSLLVSKPFSILLWVDNILIYFVAMFYIISAFDNKKGRLIKISFAVFSILTTLVVSTLVINFVAHLFGIF